MPYPGDIDHPRTWMFMNSRILLLGLAFLADGEADETSSLELRSRPVEGALGTMPHNPWRPLGGEIVLAGNTFAVEVGADGESARIDTDGDGRCERELDGHRSTVHLRAGSDAGAFEYWVRIERHGADWTWSPGALRTGSHEGVRIALYDLNGDGDFVDFGEDAVLVGSDGSALLSRVVSIHGDLMELELDESASEARLRVYQGPRAWLDVRSAYISNGVLTHAVFKSETDHSFDLASSPGGLEIPAGVYRLVSGRVESSNETAVIGPGRMNAINLGPGESHQIEWGGPIHARFKMRRCSKAVTILPNVRYFGQAGEEVVSFQPTSKPPRIEVLDVETGKLIEYGHLGGRCGGGLSACRLQIPKSRRVEVRLEHEREIFGPIIGTRR